MNRAKNHCSDCQPLDRRRFIQSVGAAAVAVPSLFGARAVHGAPSRSSSAETAVARFHQSLSDEQRQQICLPFEHESRQRISANWHVVDPVVGDSFYTDEQRRTIDEIVRNVTSEDGYERLLRQMDDDDGGIESYSVAMFGDPEAGQFEWEMTGRHLTLRADGNTVDQAAFGGPIVYGHGEEDTQANLFHYQTQKANEVFQALDSGQAEQALLQQSPEESAVELQGPDGSFSGVSVADLSSDQKQLVEETLKVLLAPYRQQDIDEAMQFVNADGGLDKLNMAFYQDEDLNDDRVWDVWRIEGPSMVWHFRGAPHVHAYINIGVRT